MINIVDVGANWGDFGIQLARRNNDAYIHLVEPEPFLAENLRRQCELYGLAHAKVHVMALGSENGDALLHVSALGDRGTSSMLRFDKNKIATDPYWSLRTDLQHDSVISVRVICLQKFIEEQKLDRIDFIKIDVQGLDLDVLASAGDRIDTIQAGMIEVPAVRKSALYSNEHQDLHQALNFFETHGFTVVAIKPNDPACNEVNVFFTRDPENWDRNAISWGLHNLPAFDGKHYWHAHSASPSYADELNRTLITENDRLLTRINVLDQENRRLLDHILALESELSRKPWKWVFNLMNRKERK